MGGNYVALQADTGDERWAVTVDSRREYDVVYSGVRNTSTVTDGVVYVQTFAGDLYALESA